ncbi:CSLREA domain-containing protein [Agitococcus lubricus]|uniref:Rhombotarget A family protein n=1 Tax=Agitococcus lubricus TaxID=1077255 RepID=A0A2T5IZ39_9GAMM|nr:CSLREA domain-containing protein [Agitococcus lubricus]PTQ89297.1 rhombotarget A family protein [Agitococcus lubricus]
MSVSQSRLLPFILLSSLSVTTWADGVIVNTVTDEDAVENSSCSLREAIHYIQQKNIVLAIVNNDINANNAEINKLLSENKGFEDQIYTITLKPESERTAAEKALLLQLEEEIVINKELITSLRKEITTIETEMQAYRDEGIDGFGCKSTDSSSTDTITLSLENSTYILLKPITIKNSVIIQSPSLLEGDIVTPLSKTANRISIKGTVNERLFNIDDGVPSDHDNDPRTAERRIRVEFKNIDFLGNNDASKSPANGGLFYNRDELVITQSVITNSLVSGFGGAVYNTKKSAFSAIQTVFKNNQASDGAAIYSEENNIDIHRSLFTENKATNVISIASATVTVSKNSTIPIIQNTTFSNNDGTALSTYAGLTLNNLTVVLNKGGINYNNTAPSLFNSIIAGNTTDCINFGIGTDSNKAYFSNNIYQTGCDSSVISSQYNNRKITGTGIETLIADSNNDGICDTPPSVGLLCPLNYYGGLSESHKPRLLADYTTISESPIVNKGYIPVFGYIGYGCSSGDQRDKGRSTLLDSPCDLGAVELQDGNSGASTQTPRQGQDIFFGQKAIFDITEKLGDAEVWPAAYCSRLYQDTYAPYVDGCVRLTDSTILKKGRVSFETDGKHTLTYMALIDNFHGFEDFQYHVTNTISRFNDAKTKSTAMTVNVRVVSNPSSTVTSKSLDTGAFSFITLMMLGLSILWRRSR